MLVPIKLATGYKIEVLSKFIAFNHACSGVLETDNRLTIGYFIRDWKQGLAIHL